MNDVNRDAVILIPLALLFMLLVLKVNLGEWRLVLMPFTVVVLSTAICMGMVPLAGLEIVNNQSSGSRDTDCSGK